MSNLSRTIRPSDDRLLTLKEMASYLSVNERTLLKLVTEGEIPGVKIGNQWRFRKAMIDTWLDDQMLGVAPRRFEVRRRPAAPQRMLALETCFQPSHIAAALATTTKVGVI